MDVEFYKENAKNKNTTHATNSWYRKYCKWAEGTGNIKEIQNLEKNELNRILEIYFADITRNDGEEFEPSSLIALQCGLERHLKEMGCTFSILRDIEFKGSRDVLEGKAKFLRQELGKGKTPNAANSLSLEEEDTLWASGQLGMQNGRSLTNTVWFLLTQHMGLRGRQEHHAMNVQDFTFKHDDFGRRFVTFAEGVTKTRGGGLRKKQRKVIPKMFETKDTHRCPIIIFKIFLSKRPACLLAEGPIYLAIIDKPKSEIWFKISRLGINSLDSIMKSMVKLSGIETGKNLTNHSARKTVVKKLRKSGASKSEIIEITGHSNERGLDPYDSGDEQQQRLLSHVIDQHVDQPSSSGFVLKTCTKDTLPRETYQKFWDEKEEPKPGVNYNLYNCDVSINGPSGQVNNQSKKSERKRRIMYSSTDSSQE